MSFGRSLKVSVAGITLIHPVMNASGILGYLPEHADIMASWGVSSIVSKTFTREARKGYDPPIVIKLKCWSSLNAVGLSNPGVEGIENFVKSAKKYRLPVIVSVGGVKLSDFVDVAVVAEKVGSDAVELNLSCPHFEGGGIEIGRDPAAVFNVVREVASVVKIPVTAKLGLSDRLVDSSARALEAGAKALTLINTVRGMSIDVYSLKPLLSNIYGGLSGRSIHPVAVWAVYTVYRETSADIIGVGGVFTWEDAAELIAVGARAVQVGTAIIYRGPRVIQGIVRGLRSWLKKVGKVSIEELVGVAQKR
ncbi:MAG: dihydroorotate dehydrogenase PyrD [Sulfolobales archaeon]|nr:dihydroorotate dehydrogenase PyrD [Sulfolobales archaeon]MDW8083558.1 dihydroorotate dehydrogenase PyrD [Sulfolobales archaeon]